MNSDRAALLSLVAALLFQYSQIDGTGFKAVDGDNHVMVLLKLFLEFISGKGNFLSGFSLLDLCILADRDLPPFH